MVQKNETEEVGLSPEDDSLASQIRELLADGHTPKQIIEIGGYKEATVYQEARKWLKKNGKPKTNDTPALPVKLGKGELIPIETELQHIRIDGDEKYRGGVIDGMRLILIGAKLNQMLISGLSETTASQLMLLKEAKSDSKEVAQETVLEILPHIADMMKETARASSPNPMGSLLARMMEGPLTQAMSGMFKMFPGMTPQSQPGQSNLPQGWQDTTKGGK